MSKQTRKSSSAWLLHMLLAAMACIWLYVAEQYQLPSVAVIGVTGGIVTLGTFVTSARLDKQRQVHRRENRQLKQHYTRRSTNTVQLIETLPALHAMFATLHKQRANGPMPMHEFVEWLLWALDHRHSNLTEWIKAPIGSKYAKQPVLKGLELHIKPERRAPALQCAIDRAIGAITESVLRRPSTDTSATHKDQVRSKPAAPVTT